MVQDDADAVSIWEAIGALERAGEEDLAQKLDALLVAWRRSREGKEASGSE